MHEIYINVNKIKKKIIEHYKQHGAVSVFRKIFEKMFSKSQKSIRSIENSDLDFPKKFLAVSPKQNLALKKNLKLTVLIPVYAGIEETARCINSVLQSKNLQTYTLLIINDCSPIDGMSSLLDGFKTNYSNVEVLHNEKNIGFVATVNRAFVLLGGSDIILLNSDTEVANNWIDKLIFHAYSSEKTGTVTPFSNNATICSYPDINGWLNLPQGETVESIDAALYEANSGVSIEIPTAVGFCMYIKKNVIDSCGIFDYETFGKGYGEENDFCLRAQKLHGWIHLLAADTFVYHKGEMSFGSTADQRKKSALIKLCHRYPDYEKLVRHHVAKDEAFIPRIRGTASRIAANTNRSILFIIHNYGGGTEKHAKELAQYLKKHNQKLRIIYMRPSPSVKLYSAIFESSEDSDRFKFEFNCASLEELVAVAKKFNFIKAHIHHTIGYQFSVESFINKLEVGYDYTVHDFYSICPRVNLLHPVDGLCINPSINKCNSCMNHKPAVNGAEIIEWRLQYESLLNGASKVYCPSKDSETRIKSYYPMASTKVTPHEEHAQIRANLPDVGIKMDPEDPLKIVILGVLAKHKGLKLVQELIKEIKKRKHLIEIVLIGYSQEPIESYGIFKETGQYNDEYLLEAIENEKPNLILFTSIWPETYSYTLSAALATNIKIIAPDIGAFTERLSSDPNSTLYSFNIKASELLKVICQ